MLPALLVGGVDALALLVVGALLLALPLTLLAATLARIRSLSLLS